jgi:hypothetical protein
MDKNSAAEVVRSYHAGQLDMPAAGAALMRLGVTSAEIAKMLTDTYPRRRRARFFDPDAVLRESRSR